jgi:hypothetical protein
MAGWEVGCMFAMTVGAFEGNGIAAGREELYIATFHTTVVATSMGFPGVSARADWAGWEFLLAELCMVTKFGAVAALGNGGGGKHLFALAWVGEQSD